MARAGGKIRFEEYEKSLTLATQTALGSAEMIFNRGETTVQTLIINILQQKVVVHFGRYK